MAMLWLVKRPKPFYIETAITSSELTTSAFSGTTPTGTSQSAPILYNWNFTTNLLQTETYTQTFNPGPISFGRNGRPIMRDDYFNLQILQNDGTWKIVNILSVAQQSMAAQGITWTPAAPGQYAIGIESVSYYASPINDEARVVFDKGNNAYALLVASRSSINSSILMHSYDGGHSWRAYLIPGSSGNVTSVSMEVPSASEDLSHPPVLMIRPYYDWVSNPRTLQVVIPVLTGDGTISFRGPFTVVSSGGTLTDIPPAGNENAAISSGDLVHIVYTGTTLTLDPVSGRHGTPEYVMTVSRLDGSVLTGPILLGVGIDQTDETVIDEHCQPCIAMDRLGYLHVVVSGHDGPFYYFKSTNPNDASAWTTVEILGERPSGPWPAADEYTYPSLHIDPNNQPIIVARWAGHSYTFRLVVMFKSSGVWVQDILVDPGRPYYGIWYHKTTLNKSNNLFIHYKYYPDNIFSDEATIIQNTYGLTLTPNPPSCVATAHNAPTPSYCAYNGYATLNNALMCSSDTTYATFNLTTVGWFFV